MSSTVSLGRGLFDDSGSRHVDADLRPLDGVQELALGELALGEKALAGEAVGPVTLATQHAVLAASIARIGGYTEIDAGLVASLSRGDRQVVALHLRRSLSGDDLQITVRCSAPGCGELADLDLRVTDLLPVVDEPEPAWIRVDTAEGVALVRPPTGLDETAVTQESGFFQGTSFGGDRGSRRARAALLWTRLVAAVGDLEPVTPHTWTRLQATTRQQIALGLARDEVAPTLSFASRCPACRAGMDVDLDAFDLLARELRRGTDRLLLEVHALAYHYGWSEPQILDLPRARRWRYIDLVRRQVAGTSLEAFADG